MDESDNAPHGEIRDQMSDAAKNLAGDATKTLGEIKGMGPMSFFSFDRMYFPIIARYVFIIMVILILIGAALGIIGGFIGIFTQGVGAGLGAIIGSVIFAFVFVILTRFWFEFILVGFKINENVQKMADHIGK